MHWLLTLHRARIPLPGLLCSAACALAPAAQAQSAPEPPAAPSPTANAPPRAKPTQLEAVEVTGQRADDTQQRRQSTAAKIIVGRDEIERFGDSTVGDLLKRLPGVTLQGQPGRGGNIRMRGLGSGYTQILLDGERVPVGFSLDSLSPEQIERIEILRAPTAETGARAIAGTINIITREGFVKRLNELRLGIAAENGRVQPSASWTRNDTLEGLIYNYSLTAFHNDRRSDSTTSTVAREIATDTVTLDQRDTGQVRERRQGLHASGRLQWRGEQGHSLTLMPLLIHSSGNSQRSGQLQQSVGATPAPYELAETAADGSFTLLRLSAQWNQRLADGARAEWKAGAGRGRSLNHSLRQETTAGVPTRTLDDRADTRDTNLSLGGKFIQLLADDHSLVAGGEAESNRRVDARTTLQDGAPLLADFGDNVEASATRVALYAQDEWHLTPEWAAHAGLRWEGIRTRGSGAGASVDVANRSSVWTPLLHAVWKPDPRSRDQVRLSLTRSYRSPTLQNLIARPSINTRYPVSGPNTPTQSDRVGNPDLKPELATGIDIAAERFLGGGGLLSANVFVRRISNFMRSQTTLESVSWSAQPRWVSRIRNVGDAQTRGLELEAKFRLSDMLPDAPRLDLRSNASVYRSRVADVPGPDNRLDQQPDWTANVGADYRASGLPLTLGGNLNWTPGYTTRLSDVQKAVQGRKIVADAYALWVFNPALQLRLTASNLAPRDYVTGGSFDDAGVRETSTSTAPTYLNLQLRLEIKL